MTKADASARVRSSRIPRFYQLGVDARSDVLREHFGLNEEDIAALGSSSTLQMNVADKMIENCVGLFPLPIGLGLNFRVNEKDYAVPMAIEVYDPPPESTVVRVALLQAALSQCATFRSSFVWS